MTTVFISHSSKDNAITREVHEWLNDQGYGPVFVDFSPEDGLIGGLGWRLQLSENVKRAKVFLIVASAFWTASKFCREELAVALGERKPIVILRLDEAELDPYLDQIQLIDFRAPDTHAWRRLARALAEAGADPSVFRPDPSRPPFPGLSAFDVEDSALYFGRETAISDLLTRLDQRRLGPKRLLVIAGPSGSGKSSLLRAGLIARLRRKPGDWLAIKPFRPSRGFDEGVVRALESSCLDWYQSRQALHGLRQLADPARADPVRFAGFFQGLAGEPNATPVLAVDQGEELFSDESGGAMEAIIGVLARLLTVDSPILGLITIRSDMLGRLQQHPVLSSLIMDDIYSLPPMPHENYSMLIYGPINQYADHVQHGSSVEPELCDALISKAAGADALPLIAFTLRMIWDEYACGDGRLLASHLNLIGGVDGAVARTADQIVAASIKGPASGELEALRTAFVAGLVGVTEHGEMVRRHVREDLLPAGARPLLDRFVQARLLVRSDGPGGHRYLEIAHEALLRQWPMLAGWIRQDSDTVRTLEELGRAAAVWDHAARDPELLVHRGKIFAKALSAVERDLVQCRFSVLERDTIRDYLISCQDLERERAARQFSLEIPLAAALYERVQREIDQCRFIHAAALCGAILDGNPYVRSRDEVIASCGPEDVNRARSIAWRVRSELHAIFARDLFGFEFRLQRRIGIYTRLVFHPDSETLTVIEGARPFDISLPAGTVRDWTALPGEVLDFLPASDKVLLNEGKSFFVAERGSGRARQETRAEVSEDSSLRKARLSADGATAIVMDIGSCVLIDFTGKEARDLLSGVSRESRLLLYGMSSGPDKEVAVTSASEIFVIDPLDGSVKYYESGQRTAINSVAITRDGNELVFGGVDSGIYTLDLPSGMPELIGRHASGILSLAPLENGRLLVSTGWDGRAAIWDTDQRRHLLDLPTDGDTPRESAASPDNERLAIASENSVTVWRKIPHAPVTRLHHGNTITGIACARGRRGRIVSVSWIGERCAAIWTLDQGEAAPLDLGIRAPLRGVSMAPADDVFAICGDMPDVIVYSAAGKEVRRFVSEGIFESRSERIKREASPGSAATPETRGFVLNVSVSHDSARVAWVAPTGRICIGDISTGDVGIALPDAGSRFSTVCFSPAEDAFVAVTEAGDAYWIRPDGEPRVVVRDVAAERTFGRGAAVAFSPDGRKLAIATSGSSIAIVSPDGQEPELRLDGHIETFMRNWRESVAALAFDPQGDFLVSAGSGQSGGTDPRTIRLWDPRTGDQLMRISIDADCLALAVDPFSDTICAGYGDKVSLIPFRRWLLSPDTAAIRTRLEGMLGSSYEYVV